MFIAQYLQSLSTGDLTTDAKYIAALLGVSTLVYIFCLAIYRVWFHPLAKYPGPLLGRITPLYDFYIAYGEKRAHHFAYMHAKYGPVVRFTPDYVSFNSVKAFEDIYGWKANVRKTDSMTSTQSDPETMSTFSEIHRVPALKKRKILQQGFSESALRDAEEFIVDQINIFCRELVNPATEHKKDMSLWLNYLAYDIMGEIVFGKGFNMMTNDKIRYILPLIDDMTFSMLLGGIIPSFHKWGLIDWIFPRISAGRMKFIKESEARVSARIAEGVSTSAGRKDFFYHLMKHRDPETGQPLSKKMLLTEGVLLITAGSDTTSTGLAAALFYLLKHPHCMKRLREELDSVFETVEEIRMTTKMTKCRYLKACIDESLRMAPPGPGMSPRTVMEGGMMIDGEYFPEGTDVGGAAYTYAYNPDNFTDPEVFRPERFLLGEGEPEPDVLRAKGSYWPFGTGVRKCPGMKMALQELYLGIARTVYLFDITSEKPEELKTNFEILDHFSE
ncbi:hypothetical protein B0A52_00418 [Exophiala mesophila]|uniref:Uncharacterized protein n=1 Tax=Exophiala mesophila TaxID=212818 RepID=A0A438NJZ8_EXOME|nr:hypothetical protein B0A52_00418 [Exophiala mesophila]